MKTTLKCSNCGAEIDTMQMAWGKKSRWVLFLAIPMMFIGFWPAARLMFFRPDPVKDLTLSEVTQRWTNSGIDVLGLIDNHSSHDWTSVTLQADFFDHDGKFIDLQTEYLSGGIRHQDQQHFKITLRSPSAQSMPATTKVVVKVAGGITSPF